MTPIQTPDKRRAYCRTCSTLLPREEVSGRECVDKDACKRRLEHYATISCGHCGKTRLDTRGRLECCAYETEEEVARQAAKRKAMAQEMFRFYGYSDCVHCGGWFERDTLTEDECHGCRQRIGYSATRLA